MKARLLLMSFLPLCACLAALEPGDKIQLSIRGVVAEDQRAISGDYRLAENGTIRLPMLDAPIAATGLEEDQLARAIEKAYRDAGIFNQPVVGIEILEGGGKRAGAVISVAGNIGRAGEIPYRKNMTLLQAIDAAGGRNPFGGRNILLFRNGKQFTLDFNNLDHKNIILKPGDSLQVEQKAVIDRWKGDEERIQELK